MAVAFIPFGSKIGNFTHECKKMEALPATNGIEYLRVVMPRCLNFLYTMRNKRGIGHVGGDVEANSIDSATLAQGSDWVVCELIRIFHGLSLEEAQDLVDNLAVRQLPDIWDVGGKKRVLLKGLSASQQTLLLLYSDPSSLVLAEDLCAWVEYSRPSMFKRNILRPLHKERLIEFDEESEVVYLSPLGSKNVEDTILRRAAI